MVIKTLNILCLLLILISCKNNQEAGPDDNVEKQSQEITELDISKLKYIDYALDAKTEDTIKDWQAYYQLQDVIINIKKGDLSFFNNNEEEVKILLSKLRENIPQQISSPSVLARILVLETKILKLESLSNLATTSKEELLITIKEFLVACSNINFQMNKKIEFDGRDIEKP
ncbi:hypothetical protein L3X39_01860 [Sabulilitoribacter multivorans]|uniref:Uncharacterized protein n=1 Tax=Flaviramulus multivorans TaxID=1304750 RepID=A0ABS9IF23_9FLAO|nr:hypothetical protein [Flaviramulus multivorans]MCF7559367.1 hypothetical protein [Flaviramulus multivorans]